MADLLTVVTAFKSWFTCLTTTLVLFFTENICQKFFSTITKSIYHL